jgi:hypothetical protein
MRFEAFRSLGDKNVHTAVLNSPVVTERVRPLQARGEHNPRHFHKFVWKLPIPTFDPSLDAHRQLVQAAIAAAQFVARLELPRDVRFETVRRFVREELDGTTVGQEMNVMVTALLDAATNVAASQ